MRLLIQGKVHDVGNGVLIAHDPGAILEAPVEYAEQSLRFRDVAFARALVLVVLARKFMEKPLPGRTSGRCRHLEHQPLEGLIAARSVRGMSSPVFSAR